MKNKSKIILGGIVALFGVIALTGCTKSFCSAMDSARGMYAFDNGVTKYEAGTETWTGTHVVGEDTYTVTVINAKKTVANFDTTNLFYYDTPVAGNPEAKTYVTYLNNVIRSNNDGGLMPITKNQVIYFSTFDDVVLQAVLDAKAATINRTEDNVVIDMSTDLGVATFNRMMSYYSFIKFSGYTDNVWYNWDLFDKQVRETVGVEHSTSIDFVGSYKITMNSLIANYRTCLATNTDKYGTYGYSTDGIYVDAKTWGYAWSKGLFEGLLVYPIGWLIDQIGVGFKNVGANDGVAALLAIFFVTLIVRGIMLLATLKQTNGNAKMTELQPEITKIQNKYPNSNTNKYEKQRMAEEVNALYRKNKINPISTIITLIIQFPVFICVWGALSGASILTSGSILGLNLSMSIKDAMFNGANWGPAGGYSGVTAFILFLLMAIAQTVSMLLPQWQQKAKAKKVARLGKNPSQKSQNNKMKWVTYIMLVFIIIMGFSLVSAMGVYWLVGALISIAQTLITQAIQAKKTKEKKRS